jgi:hypothetical protein
MSGQRLIDAYLAALGDELALPRRMRERVVDEARDHLLCAVADLTREGRSQTDAIREALARHGSAATVARSHARARSSRATARLAPGVVACVGSFGLLFAATTQVPAVQAGIPATAMTSGAAGVAGWIAVQLAGVCGALAVIRGRRLRGRPEPLAGTLRLVNRSAATALVAIGLSLLIDAIAFVRMPAGQGQYAALVFGLVLLSTATAGFTAAQTLVAQRRLRALERFGREPVGEDALDDLREAALAALRELERLPLAAPVAARAERAVAGVLAARSPVTRVLRGHPWRFGAGVALLTGVLAGAAHLVAEGPPADGAAVALLVVAIIATIEGAAVFACYVLLGRFLGIRGSAGRRPPRTA